jgi:hypothetical protein
VITISGLKHFKIETDYVTKLLREWPAAIELVLEGVGQVHPDFRSKEEKKLLANCNRPS